MTAGRPGTPGAFAALAVPWALLALILLAPPVFPDTAADLLSAGRKAFTDGSYGLAAESFRRVTREFPAAASADESRCLLGVTLFYEGDWSEALDRLKAFLVDRPRSPLQPRVLFWCAAACMKLGRYEDALRYLRQRPLRPDDGDPYRFPALLAAGTAAEALGRDAEAAAFFSRILGDPAAAALHPEATYRLACTEYRAGRFEAARALYGRLLLGYPQSPFVSDAVFFLAECSLALGNLEEAEKGYRSILSLYPGSPWREACGFRLAEAAWRRKEADKALELLAAPRAGGAWQGSALRLGADIQLARGSYPQAAEGYQRALALLRPGAEQKAAWHSLGVAQAALGMKPQAADSLARAGGEKAMWERALLLAEAGNDGAAIPALQDFLKAFPGSANGEEARGLLGALLEKTGAHSAALAAWDVLASSFPRSPLRAEYLFRRGSGLLSLGRATDALDDFQRVVRDYPRSPWRQESAYCIGWVYDQRGEYPRALPWFQSVDPAAGEVGERSQLAAGLCLFNMGSFDKAAASLKGLRAKNPTSVSDGTIALSIGRALYRGGKPAEAAERLAEAAELLSGQLSAADALYWLGWSNMRLRKYPEARDAFLSLANGFPGSEQNGDALLRAGICETLQGSDDSAVEIFGRLLDADTGGRQAEQALYEQLWAYRRLGRTAEGEQSLARLLKEFPTGALAPQAVYKAAEQDLGAGNYAGARAGFQRVAREFPSSALAGKSLYWAAEADLRSGDPRAALEGFWACVKANARDTPLDSVLAGCRAALVSAGSADLGRRYVEKARETRGIPTAAVAGIELAAAEILLAGAPEEALGLIEDARRRAPPEPYAGMASFLLGCYQEGTGSGDTAAAIFAALETTRRDETGARAAREHARVLESTGRTAEALEKYVEASTLFPGFPDIAAESLFNAARLSRARGERDRGAGLEQELRKRFPASPWVERLDAR
jgi:TolA-binding protein